MITSLPTHLELAVAIAAVISPLALTGTVEEDPSFHEDPSRYASFVDGHGVVIEYTAKTASVTGPYEARHTFALHSFYSFDTDAPSGKTRAEAFAEMLRDIDLAIHNAPRLGVTGAAYTVLHQGVSYPGGTLRIQSDQFMSYYALLELSVSVKAC
jgi:hypothetical protein